MLLTHVAVPLITLFMDEYMQIDSDRIKNQPGFTLIELMLVLAVLAILLLVVAPNFSSFIAEGRVSTTKGKLHSSISLARTESIKRGTRVAVCRANNAETNCAGTSIAAGNADWSNGWLVFADDDEDSSVDAGELIRVQTDINAATGIQYSRGDMIIYDGLGMLITAANGDETFIVSDSSGSASEDGLSVRATGRVRSCADWNGSTDTCDDS